MLARNGVGSDHGVSSLVVVKVPQVGGVISGACVPSRKWKLKWLIGNCGLFWKTVVSWPVAGFGVTWPASLIRIPVSGFLMTMYSATSDPFGCPGFLERVFIGFGDEDRTMQRAG